MLRTILLAILFATTSCSKSEPAQTSAGAPTKPSKDPATAKKMIAAGAVVLDVRTVDEFNAGHLPTANNIPIDHFAERVSEVEQLASADKTKPIVVYCAAGGRAAKAKRALEAAGFTQVVNGGGFDDLR
jgi:phage shock protein E